MNLTNRYILPTQLKYIILDMATDYYKNYLISEMQNSNSSNNIVRVTEEGRSVEFGQANESAINSLLSAHISNQLELRKKEIYRYRLLYKGKEDGQS